MVPEPSSHLESDQSKYFTKIMKHVSYVDCFKVVYPPDYLSLNKFLSFREIYQKYGPQTHPRSTQITWQWLNRTRAMYLFKVDPMLPATLKRETLPQLTLLSILLYYELLWICCAFMFNLNGINEVWETMRWPLCHAHPQCIKDTTLQREMWHVNSLTMVVNVFILLQCPLSHASQLVDVCVVTASDTTAIFFYCIAFF